MHQSSCYVGTCIPTLGYVYVSLVRPELANGTLVVLMLLF
jgi:hypothetical protein